MAKRQQTFQRVARKRKAKQRAKRAADRLRGKPAPKRPAASKQTGPGSEQD